MRILYIDVETVPRGADELIGTPEPWAPPGWVAPERPAFVFRPERGATKAETLAAQEAKQRAEYDAADWIGVQRADALHAWGKGSRDYLHARIVCVGIGVGNEVVQHVGPGAAGWTRAVIADVQPTHIAGWNVGFDAGMLWADAIRSGVDLPELAPIQYRTARAIGRGDHTFPELLDLADLIPGRAKQREIAEFFGIADDHPLRGSDVLAAYLRGNLAGIVGHNERDVLEMLEFGPRLLRAAGVAL